MSFDTSGNKKYPLFLEVYAGPEFQKIQQTFKRGWPQIHLPAAYDCITVSVDGRGSAFQGDRFMFSNYRALAQTERVDQTGKIIFGKKIKLCSKTAIFVKNRNFHLNPNCWPKNKHYR